MRWLIVLMLCAALNAGAQEDGGGRDVSVALFSAQAAQSVRVMAAGPEAWWAACAGCRHQPLKTTLRMPALREIVAGGPLTVLDEEHAQARTANGRWHLRVRRSGGVDVVLTLPSERYVEAVLMGETTAKEPRDYLRAMAVVARTFVLRSSSAKAARGRLPSDTCDSTACQVMRLGPVSDAVFEAVRSTTGETLWFGARRAQVFFSGSCGGVTETGGAMWPTLARVPYLRSVADPYCVRRGRASWHAEISLTQFAEVVKHEGWKMPPHIVSVQISERSSSRRARKILFVGDQGERGVVSAPTLRLAIGRSLGWNLVRSDAYGLKMRDDVLVFDGEGHGHGVGLCQQGAEEMASSGKSYREILAFYFPGTKVRITRSDEGWTRSSQNGIVLMSAGKLTSAFLESSVKTWSEAKRSFPLQRPVEPMVVLAPTTEIFSQMTAQPGWQAASTSGATIVLQPAVVLEANHLSLEKTLRHEMLHVAVESGANAKSSLWLREGLVEVLAGDAVSMHSALSAEETERLLLDASTQHESEAAHLAAGARVKRLLQRYGSSAVRGWIVSGASVPAE